MLCVPAASFGFVKNNEVVLDKRRGREDGSEDDMFVILGTFMSVMNLLLGHRIGRRGLYPTHETQLEWF